MSSSSEKVVATLGSSLDARREELRKSALLAVQELPAIAEEFRSLLGEGADGPLNLTLREKIAEDTRQTAIEAIRRSQTEKRLISEMRAAVGNEKELDLKGVLTTPAERKIPVNQTLKSCGEQLKAPNDRLRECCDTITFWLLLEAPRLEDGGNFGVEVQDTAASWVATCKQNTQSLQDSYGEYSLNRATQFAGFRDSGFEGVDDWEDAVVDLDDQRFMALRNWCRHMENAALSLCDGLAKNWKLVERPKGDDDQGAIMY